MGNQPARVQTSLLTGLLSGAGLFVAASLQAFASTGINPDCSALAVTPETVEIAPPSLRIKKTELGKGKPLPITTPESASDDVTPTFAASDVIDDLLGKDEIAAAPETSSSRVELPPTATRLPGVDEDDLPKFRRQMFRTDI